MVSYSSSYGDSDDGGFNVVRHTDCATTVLDCTRVLHLTMQQCSHKQAGYQDYLSGNVRNIIAIFVAHCGYDFLLRHMLLLHAF